MNAAEWWRTLSWVGDHRIAITGDLARNRAQALVQLDEWVSAGVTHVIDVRAAYELGSDISLVSRHAPIIRYHWVPAEDDGLTRDDAWFATGVGVALEALRDPDARIMIHCHMGVNRAPSMALAVLLSIGTSITDALTSIRSARPIAAALYSVDAVSWFARETGADLAESMASVSGWHQHHPIDVDQVICDIDEFHSTL